MRKTHHRLVQQLLEPFHTSGEDDYDEAQVKSGLLHRVRWYVILAQLAVMYPALQTGYLLAHWVTAYLVVVTALGAFNFVAKKLAQPWGLFLQLSLDLAALAALLILTSGCQNPFASLLFVGSIFGPILLSRTWAVVYLVESAVALSVVCFYTEPQMVNANGHQVSTELTVGVKIFVLFAMGTLALWLKARLDQAQSRYENLYRQRQRLNNFRAMGIVAGQLSHELSTPLNTIKIMMDRLKRNPDFTLSQELRVASSALQQCEQSIKDLFDCGVDAKSLSFKETHLANFVKSVCDKWHLDFPEVNLRFDIEEDVQTLTYKIPATPFAQAVLDILDNAKEASEREQAEISVSMQANPQRIQISIADRGRGLDEEIVDRLGEPFVSTKNTGTGLGVYNAAALLEALGGSLGLKPRQGGGTQVSMVLPL